jgi:short-subunit dehydrogenase
VPASQNISQHISPGSSRHILITGASGGLGAALAEAYAGPGVRLSLAGRNAERLAAVAAICLAQGAHTEISVFDVTDAETARDWVQDAARASPLDLLIANAGISAGTGSGGETAAQAREIFAINVDGVANTVLPAIGQMQPRGHGQIAIMSSVAGFVGFPGSPAYCASKAAVRVWGESLRGDLAASGIRVSVICPGFIRTPMTDLNPFPMPFLTDPEKAARIILARLARNHARIAFPWPLYVAVRTLGALPAGLRDRLLRAAPRKP